jgi:hypothetical protein
LNKTVSYEIELMNISPRQWDDFLITHSGLPGSGPNMELAWAFAQVGTLMDFKKYIQLSSGLAPENTPAEFLVFCGVLGLGKYLSKRHDQGLLMRLREMANDPREQIQEAVLMALQEIGAADRFRLLKYAKSWINGTFLEQRAAIAALCTSNLLSNQEIARETLTLLDWVTATMVELDQQQNQEYRILQQELEKCWSIAVADLPEKGKPMMERWMKEDHPVIKVIMKANLQQQRLTELDEEWVTEWRAKI